jgi:hypothetical protein
MRGSALMIWATAALMCAPGGAARAAEAAESQADRDAAALAATIDKYVAAKWKEKGAQPTDAADDGEFLRRVTLDLNGRIPAISNAPTILGSRDFIEMPYPDKRAKLVRALLDSDLYATHFADVWQHELVPGGSDPFRGFNPYQTAPWLRKQFKENVGYDKIARAIVTGSQADPGVQQFLQVNEYKPEKVASRTARLFLGVKVECAQCHNHPFAKWTRQQFWDYAAFFAMLPGGQGVRPRKGGVPVAAAPGELIIPGTDKKATPHFLDGKAPDVKAGDDPRVALADWMTSPDNPYFARAAVNHTWEYFFGAGLVEPLDEETDDNPPSHPELLDEMAKAFVAHNYDLKWLMQSIMLSKTYQLSSRRTHPSQDDPRLFARARVRGLGPEQLYDSLAVATNHPADQAADYNPNNPPFGFGPQQTARLEFLGRFPNQDKRVETQTSILQALYFMNGKVVTDATSRKTNENLNVLINDTSGSVSRRVEQIFLIVLSRKPRPEERERYVAYIEKGGPDGDRAKAFTDVFWVLLNSGEFAANH